MPSIASGTRIAGFEILKKIGQGGMGDVYCARQESLNRVVALKVLPPELSRNPEFSERFESEAKVVSLLQHHNIVAIYDFGQLDGLRYFAMQYVEGESLDQKIQREKRLDVETAVEISRQILRALKYAHEHKVIHRDIKPHNVLMEKNGKVLVSDFGIAKIFANTRLTHTGMAVGTPEYMSPEQSEGSPLDVRTDIYSLGIVMYEMLTGTPPFTGESPLAVAYRQVNEQPKPPYDLNEEIPQQVGLIILKALKKDRKDRYQSSADMLNTLDLVADKEDADPAQTNGVLLPFGRNVENSGDQRITDRRMGDRRHLSRRGRSDYRLWMRILAGSLAVFGLILAFIGYRTFFTAQEEGIIKNLKVSVSSADLSPDAAEWNMKNLTDGDTTTAWAPGGSNSGINEYVLFTFSHSMHLSRLCIWNGNQKVSPSEWADYGRVKGMEIRFSNNLVKQIDLSDRYGMQSFLLPMPKTTFIRLTITSVYPGKVQNLTPVSEVRLWGIDAP
jgi:serine/threonine-protein kinase